MATKKSIKNLKDEMQKMEGRLVTKLGAIASLSIVATAIMVSYAVRML